MRPSDHAIISFSGCLTYVVDARAFVGFGHGEKVERTQRRTSPTSKTDTMKVILYALFASLASAYVVVPKTSARPSTHLNENFGLGIGEDSYENQVDLLRGEANYKQWVNRVNENNMLNRKVSSH